MKKFRMYVDESGTADFTDKFEHMNKYLTLTGIIVNSEDKIELHNRLNIFKKEVFDFDVDTDHWSLHKSDAVCKKKFYSVLHDENRKKTYDTKLIELLRDTKMHIISVTLDKESVFRKFGRKSKHPYHYVFENLVRRYMYFLRKNSSVGDILVEGRTPQNNKQLKECYRKIYENGTKAAFGGEDIPAWKYQKVFTSTEIKIKDKRDNVAGLQIADTLTTVMRNLALLVHGVKIETKYDREYWKELKDAVLPKIFINKNEIKGSGIVFIKQKI